MSLKKKFPEKFSFLQFLMALCILVVAPIMAGVIYDSYKSVSTDYHNNFGILKNNTEQSIIETIIIVDQGLRIYDQSLDGEMKRAFVPFLSEYDKSGGDPSEIDLNEVRGELGESFNLYIINENHTVIYSTVDSDLGLDFSYLKDFSLYLDSIREGDSYHGDRVVRGIREVESVRKYAYHPTPDHKYILELSYEIGEESPREILKYRRTIDDLKGMNSYLTSVNIYDIFGYTIGEPGKPDSELREFIKNDVIRAKNDVSVEDSENGTLTSFRFVDLYDFDAGSDPSLAIAFTYSTAILHDDIMSAWLSEVMVTAGLSVLLILVLVIFCIAVSKPVKNLTEDVDAIAGGDLDHKIRKGRNGREFLQLERSISNMVERLRETIKRLRESEELIKRQNDDLEDIVEARTKEALEKTSEANFYLDVITHDINNSNMAALGYAGLLKEDADDSNREMFKMLISAIRQNAEIIRNVSIMRKMKNGGESQLFPVELDRVIRHSVSLFPIKTIYEGTSLKVMADNLLEEVFTNILGNCSRHAGSSCVVEISIDEPSREDIRICLSDNGPGIPGEMKDKCFNRYTKNLSGGNAKGKGLGLFIVRTLVEDRYGGKVEALDVVEGRPEEGLMICITLKKGE